VQAFRPYVRELRRLADRCGTRQERATGDAVAAALDGQPNRELRRLAPIELLRDAGAFFSGATLSERLVAPILPTLSATSVICDPACGAGDLLLAALKLLPIEQSGQETIDTWSRHLIGRDVYERFVEATKIRIVLAAMYRGTVFADWNLSEQMKKLSGISRGSALVDQFAIESATHVLLNPPFSRASLPLECEWGQGSASQAAIFLEACVTQSRSGAHLLAILPDVLRSGSRYARWRRKIERYATIEHIGLHGQFDLRTDVHVFLLHLKKKNGQIGSHSSAERVGVPRPSCRKIKDLGTVHVGPVVPHRDPNTGPWRKFICARTAEPWSNVRTIHSSRRYAGRVFTGPFVVVRRTSRPGDAHRALATIVDVRDPVAVENHLLVIMPRDRTLKNCRRIVKVLQDSRTTEWLDNRIRCRHLTVPSLEAIPEWIVK
jgi:hypothetical protein